DGAASVRVGRLGVRRPRLAIAKGTCLRPSAAQVALGISLEPEFPPRGIGRSMTFTNCSPGSQLARGVLRPSRSLTPRIVERSRRRHDAGDTRPADAELFDSRGYTDGSNDVPDGRWDVCGRVGASLGARARGNDAVPCVHERLMVEHT